MNAVRLAACAALALALLPAPPLAAHDHPDPSIRDRVSFQVARTTRVGNDRMTAVLEAVHESEDAAEAASRVNEAMAWAVARVEGVEGVRHRTGAYRTQQVTTPQRQRRWRAEQELRLESEDFDRMRELLGGLQERLQLQSLGFSLSQERRVAREREMARAALEAFREEAELIRTALGFEKYDIVEMRVETSTHDPGQRRGFVGLSAMREGADAAVAPVVIEEGESEVRGAVQATIQLE